MTKPPIDEADIIVSFCKRLKNLRQSNNLTLDELAQKSGVSISTISKIENQQQKPSFETVLRVARALHINFIHMLEEPPEQKLHMARRVITRAADAPSYEGEFNNYVTHAAELSNKTMVPLLMSVKARSVPPLQDWSVHDGEEFVYVIDGEIELHTEQYSPVILKRGDSCYLDSTMRHAYVSRSKKAASIMAVCLSIKPFADAS